MHFINESLAQVIQVQFFQNGFHAHFGGGFFAADFFGDDELIFHGVFPADQFGDGDLIAVGFELQAAQDVGDLAAEFAGVQWVAPDFGQGGFAEASRFVGAQDAGDFGLTTGDEDDVFGIFGEGESDGVVGGGIAGVQGGDHFYLLGQCVVGDGVGDAQVVKAHAGEACVLCQHFRALDEFGAGFDAFDVAMVVVFDEQIVEDEAEIRFACAVVNDAVGLLFGFERLQHGFDELKQMINLFEFAAAVLVELAVAGEDVQGFEQFDRLVGVDVGGVFFDGFGHDLCAHEFDAGEVCVAGLVVDFACEPHVVVIDGAL